jgi:hypothetical protein
MQEIKSKWSSDLSAEEMEDMVTKMDELIADHKDSMDSLHSESSSTQDKALKKSRQAKIKQLNKAKSKYTSFLRKMKKTMNSKLISMGDRRGFENQEEENEDRIIDAVKDVNRADETGKSALDDLLKQKEQIMGFNNHLGNVAASVAQAERFVRMMRDRDKRHRCYVALMILGMFAVIGSGGAAIFA